MILFQIWVGHGVFHVSSNRLPAHLPWDCGHLQSDSNIALQILCHNLERGNRSDSLFTYFHLSPSLAVWVEQEQEDIISSHDDIMDDESSGQCTSLAGMGKVYRACIFALLMVHIQIDFSSYD